MRMKRNIKPMVVTFALISVVLMWAVAGTVSGADGTCNCSTCNECEAKLNDPTCTIVTLTADIKNQSGTCIDSPANFTNKVFDCQNHMLDGDNVGVDFGIILQGKSGNTIRNCIICEFYEGIDLRSSSNHNRLINNTLNYNGNHGIYIGHSANNTFINNTASFNQHNGLYVTGPLTNLIQFNTFCNNNLAGGIWWFDIVDLDATIGNNNTCDTTDGYNDPDYSGCSRLCDSSDGIRCGCVGATQTFLPGDTVTESCTLNCDVSARGTCFTIGADNLTLDGAGHHITGNATGSGIEATGKNKVIITNITITNFMNGIYLENSNNCTIMNCTTNNNTGIGIARGIYFKESNHNSIVDSRADGNDFQGIYLHASNNNNIANTTANSNGNYGIVLWSVSDNNIVTNNTASQNDRGVTLGYSNTNLISNNTIRNNSVYGIELQQPSDNNTFANNTIVDNGQIGIYSGMHHHGYYSLNKIVYNTITNHDYGIYLFNATNTTVDRNTVTLATTGMLVEKSSHNTISNNSVNTYSSTGISLYYNSPYNWLINNTVFGGADYSGNIGISLDWADHTLLIKNTVTNNRGRGISISGNSMYALVDHNEVRNNRGYGGTGIGITSSRNNVTNNTICSNDIGVSIINSAHNITLFNNTLDHNTEKGIDLWAGEYSTITNNWITNNGEYGISIFEYSDHNTITENTVCQNGISDFYLEGLPVWNSGENNTCYSPDGWDDTGTVGCTYLCEVGPVQFDTGPGTYPSIAGVHNGTITPNQTILVHHLYTFPCAGTGGHTEYVAFYNTTTGEEIANSSWNGYKGDWHNITFDEPFALYYGKAYNYTIHTGSYPQIIHERLFNTTGGTIACTEFVDVNGKRHEGWIPAIRLE